MYYDWLTEVDWESLNEIAPYHINDMRYGRIIGVFDVLGNPRALPREKINFKTKAMYKDKDVIEYKANVANKADRALRVLQETGHVPVNDKVAVELAIKAQFQTPKSRWKASNKETFTKGRVIKPDFDNLGKMIADALNEVLYHDDKQVSVGMIHKVEVAPDKPALVRVAYKFSTRK